jgi:serine/threonine-protein kinase
MSSNEPIVPLAQSGAMSGDVVAGHRLGPLLAVGGMGEVYLATHLTLGVARAIKVIRADLRDREDWLERFDREAQVLARLQHNSIVQIIEFGSLANGWPFLAMEYIDGPSLDALVASEPLSVPAALVVLEQMAHALRHAHTNSVIHRDLKPSNVLVRSADVRQVKIIDFGLARVLDGDGQRLTADGQTFGAPAYMAPELAEGARDVTSAVDIYALGAIAYLLVSKDPPFVHKKRVQLMAAHVNDPPPPLSERCPNVPEFLDELVLQCLAKDPAQRPSADALVAQLGHHVRGIRLAERERPSRPSIEVVAAPWSGASAGRDTAAELLDEPVPQDPDGRGLALSTRIMSIIEEIATYLSTSDPELTSLLRLEARICEQLAHVERELAVVAKQLEAMPGTIVFEQHRDSLLERVRTLNAQQVPLQRRMVQVVDAYRSHASGQIKALFRQLDRALHELKSLRRELS